MTDARCTSLDTPEWWMSDSLPLPPGLAFEPVLFERRRRDGWTPERQRGFILALSKIGMVSAAAKSVGMSRKSVYALLERAGPKSSFARAFDEATEMARTKAWYKAVDRRSTASRSPISSAAFSAARGASIGHRSSHSFGDVP